MKKLLSPVLSAMFFLVSCASYHHQKPATVVAAKPEEKKDMEVSMEEITELSDQYHSMIVFTFENKTGDWKRFKTTTVSCGSKCDPETNIILGDDLQSWTKSQLIKQTIEQHNNALLYAGMMIAGMAIGAAGAAKGNEGTMNAGLGVYAAGAGMTGYTAIKNAQLGTKIGAIDPYSDHVYNRFSVPAGGVAKKWILLNKKNGTRIKKFRLSMETETGETQQYETRM